MGGRRWLVGLVLSGAVLTGCELEEEASVQAEPSGAAEPADASGSPLGGDDPQDKVMPDVLCMDLQAAQDEIQDHGVLLSGSTDATGQGRNQIIDSNWVVVDQFPAPGTPIGEGDAELYVVKDGEQSESWLDHPC